MFFSLMGKSKNKKTWPKKKLTCPTHWLARLCHLSGGKGFYINTLSTAKQPALQEGCFNIDAISLQLSDFIPRYKNITAWSSNKKGGGGSKKIFFLNHALALGTQQPHWQVWHWHLVTDKNMMWWNILIFAGKYYSDEKEKRSRRKEVAEPQFYKCHALMIMVSHTFHAGQKMQWISIVKHINSILTFHKYVQKWWYPPPPPPPKNKIKKIIHSDCAHNVQQTEL